MTLAIVFKGSEGIVLAADSRVTLTMEQRDASGVTIRTQSHYDNATKLLKVSGQDYVAAVTFGLGTLGNAEPRTAHSLLPEFDAELAKSKCGRLPVKDFAERLSQFFLGQHKALGTPAGPDMHFLVGGYDEGAPYGKMFEVRIPSAPDPQEHNAGHFGLRWGGQAEVTSRILNGVDTPILNLLGQAFKLDAAAISQLNADIQKGHALPIPYQFLPLQDCVDLATLLVETTSQLMRYIMGTRGVGGAIDVATITRTDGYSPVQVKAVKGRIT